MAMTSIRRKVYVGLTLITALLVTLATGGAVLLSSYGQLVDELDLALNDVPEREPLLRASHDLQTSLNRFVRTVDAPVDDSLQAQYSELLRARRRELAQAATRLQEAVRGFRAKMNQLVDGRRGELNDLVLVLVQGIEWRTSELAIALQNVVADDTDRARIAEAQRMADELDGALWSLPEPAGSIGVPLDRARRFYRSGSQILLGVAGVLAAILFVVYRCSNRWFLRPIKILHDGTSRVAQGDFDYRVRLEQSDEMGELADAFNKMTIRFQEIKHDLDRQVRERVKQLIRSERLAGIGFLATGVAHEINTPLTGILGAAQALIARKDEYLSNLSDEERQDLLDYLEIMEDASKQCRAITDRLLQYARGEESRGDSTVRNPVDLAQIVRDVLHMVSHMSRFRQHKLRFDFPGESFLHANGTEIKQVVLNLVANGLEAMPDGGTLSVELIEATDQVELRIRDEGIGMTPEVIENLFEPFFTQNKPGQGTGLGMAITHRIVSDHGGTIEPQSDGPGAGSTFVLHLPRRLGVSRAA